MSTASMIDLAETFPLFKPWSAGSHDQVAAATILSIRETVPCLLRLAQMLVGKKVELRPVTAFAEAIPGGEDAAQRIKELLDGYGSDKALPHRYHYLYGPILAAKDVSGILEIGLGTNNPLVLSNMQGKGRPGSSLRAFRDFTQAPVYGADVDPSILFNERGIETFHVDQTDAASLAALAARIPIGLDLVVDDGLHAPNANLATLALGLSNIRRGGWVVIEDIRPPVLPIWELVPHLIPSAFECHLLADKERSAAFAVQKVSEWPI